MAMTHTPVLRPARVLRIRLPSMPWIEAAGFLVMIALLAGN
jgi:hypothetical protein